MRHSALWGEREAGGDLQGKDTNVYKKRALLSLATATALVAGIIGIASPAVAADNVITDPKLQACLNDTFFHRDDATAITAAEASTITYVSCTEDAFAGISSLAGLEGAPIEKIWIYKPAGLDIAPIGTFPAVQEVVLQNGTLASSTVDLGAIKDAGDTLRRLSLVTLKDANGNPITAVNGFESFTGLTYLTLFQLGVTQLGGIEAVKTIEDLRIGQTKLGNDTAAKLTGLPLTNLYAEGGAMSDFSWVPAGIDRTKAAIAGQDYVSSEEQIAGEGAAIFINPTDVPRGIAGEQVLNRDHAPLASPIQVDLMTRIAHPGYNASASMIWFVDNQTSKPMNFTAYPIVRASAADNLGLTVEQGQPVDLDFFKIDYDVQPKQPFQVAKYELTVPSGTLPDGLTFDTTTGKISGTAKNVETVVFDVKALDALGNYVSARFQIEVTPAQIPTQKLTIELSKKEIYAGDELTIKGGGFKPGEAVTATVLSTPITVGTKEADANGNVEFVFASPADFALGEHRAVLTGATSGEISDTFKVITKATTPAPTATEDPTTSPKPSGALADTGAGLPAAGGIAGLVLLVIGAGVVIAARRRAARS